MEKHLGIGESGKIRAGSGFFAPSITVIYTGILNEDTYSIAIKGGIGNQAWSYNLFFPMNKKEFNIGKTKIQVLNVNADNIVFREI